MPELPEIHTIAERLRTCLKEARISSVGVLRDDVIHHGGRELAACAVGRKIASIDRRGKRLAIRLSPRGVVVIHLGMSGRLTLEPWDAPLLSHTHVCIRCEGREDELRFCDPRRFGGIWYYDDPDTDPFSCAEGEGERDLARLGPDALDIGLPLFREIMRRQKQVKALLLDQHAISGLGNIYCDEALYRAGIHPGTPACRLSDAQVRALAVAIRSTLKSAIAFGGSTLRDYRNADGQAGAFQKLHRVYGREGEPCGRCGRTIVRSVIAGRSTHTCPGCQKRRMRR